MQRARGHGGGHVKVSWRLRSLEQNSEEVYGQPVRRPRGQREEEKQGWIWPQLRGRICRVNGPKNEGWREAKGDSISSLVNWEDYSLGLANMTEWLPGLLQGGASLKEYEGFKGSVLQRLSRNRQRGRGKGLEGTSSRQGLKVPQKGWAGSLE